MLYPNKNVRIFENEIWLRKGYVQVYGGLMATAGLLAGVLLGLML